MLRIDTHQHMVPNDYRKVLQKAGIHDAGGRAMPDWSPESALSAMAELKIGTALLSVSAPSTTLLPDAADAAALARELNDYGAAVAADYPDRFGFFATLPMPHIDRSVDEAVRALDDLHADGVVILGNSAGTYLGEGGQDALFRALDARSAVVFIHPAELPGPPAPGVVPFAADFLLDTTRAAYLLVRNGIRQRYPNIRFILSHAGGFVPYAAHRLAMGITGDTGRSPLDSLDDFAGFYFDTALSSTAAALPSLLAFAKPGHIIYGSDWPFAPLEVSHYYTAGLETYEGIDGSTLDAINRTNALALFPRLGTPSKPVPVSRVSMVRGEIRHRALRLASRAMSTR